MRVEVRCPENLQPLTCNPNSFKLQPATRFNHGLTRMDTDLRPEGREGGVTTKNTKCTKWNSRSRQDGQDLLDSDPGKGVDRQRRIHRDVRG